MRAWTKFSVMSPVLLFFGCEAIANAYDQGYDCGYGFVDGYYNCAAGCEEQRQQRRQEAEAWSDACFLPVRDHFPDQASLDAANERCRDNGGFDDGVVVCDDLGQENGGEPNGCRPFNPPSFGTVVDENYDCPSPVAEDKLCLCCDVTGQPSCELEGGFCRDDDDCCSGSCVLDRLDAGWVDDAGTIPFPNSGECL